MSLLTGFPRKSNVVHQTAIALIIIHGSRRIELNCFEHNAHCTQLLPPMVVTSNMGIPVIVCEHVMQYIVSWLVLFFIMPRNSQLCSSTSCHIQLCRHVHLGIVTRDCLALSRHVPLVCNIVYARTFVCFGCVVLMHVPRHMDATVDTSVSADLKKLSIHIRTVGRCLK